VFSYAFLEHDVLKCSIGYVFNEVNLSCSLNINGQHAGILEANEVDAFQLPLGTNLLKFQEVNGNGNKRLTFEVKSTTQQLLTVCISKVQAASIAPVLRDARDGQNYNTIRFSNGQIWMGENLRYKPATGKSWCYDNSSSNCTNTADCMIGRQLNQYALRMAFTNSKGVSAITQYVL
jgi:hypothetical protein